MNQTNSDPLELNSSPWFKRQMEGHLLFSTAPGVLWTGITIYLFLVVLVEWEALSALKLGIGFPDSMTDIVRGNLIALGVVLLPTKVKPPVYGWLILKVLLGIICFMNLFVGAPISFGKGQSDAWVFLFLGILWFPSLEFIPAITPFQRYLTILRLILTLPALYFGWRSGYWH